jgi:hypothetical protein
MYQPFFAERPLKCTANRKLKILGFVTHQVEATFLAASILIKRHTVAEAE